MDLKLYQVDAFTTRLFGGNPAAVVPLEEWLPDATLQAIAMENNLAETAFFIPHKGPEADYHLRWFTPALEMDLCGHATLAAAHTLKRHLGYKPDSVRFMSRSGLLAVRAEGDRLVLDFPARPGRRTQPCRWPLARELTLLSLIFQVSFKELAVPACGSCAALRRDIHS